MAKIVKLSRIGNSQLVCLPGEFRLKSDEVRIRKVGDTIVLQPVTGTLKKWLATIDQERKSSPSEGQAPDTPEKKKRKVVLIERRRTARPKTPQN